MTIREAKKHVEQFQNEMKHFRKPIYRVIGTDTAEAMQIIKDNSFENIVSYSEPINNSTLPKVIVTPQKVYIAGERELRRYEADKLTRYIKIIKETFYYCGVLVQAVYNQNGIVIYNDKAQITLSKTIDKSIDFVRNNSQLIRNLLHDKETI